MDPASPQPANTQRTSEQVDPAIEFHEIEIPSWPAISRGYVVRILTGSAVAVALISLASLLPAGGGFLMLLSIGLLLAMTVSSLSVSQRDVTRSVSAAINSPNPGETLPADIARILTESLPMRSYPGGFNLAARKLAECGYRGLVIRCYLTNSPPIRPFTVEFEPCPLNEVDVAFRGIALDTDEFDDSDERVSETWRRLQRLWRVGAFWFIVPLIVFSAQAFRDAWRSQTVTTASLIWLILLLVIALSLFGGGTHASRFWIAPGCLIRRMSLWATGKLGVDMFYPGQCVLITYATRGKAVGWTIASKADELENTGTELEARTLLRAWLSPLPPPSLARVRSLFAGE
ncbi:MAG: hypothetical protein IT450_14520 [Phycisphaerales bacterium]|nr:hypothetical protein [Phycisphaerales bacterium]